MTVQGRSLAGASGRSLAGASGRYWERISDAGLTPGRKYVSPLCGLKIISEESES